MKAGSKGITLPPSIIAGIVSILLATSLIAVDGPGFPQQAYEEGQFIGQWDISHGANTRTTVMGFHRGWRFTDTRDLINQGGFQVWDISDLSNPVEVHRIDIRRSFHVFISQPSPKPILTVKQAEATESRQRQTLRFGYRKDSDSRSSWLRSPCPLSDPTNLSLHPGQRIVLSGFAKFV